MSKNKGAYEVGSLIYDANIYDGMNKQQDDLEFYRQWLPTDPNAEILELCCGTGRLTIPIAMDGHKITGVDNSTSMLTQANNKAVDAGLNIEFLNHDVRSLEIGKKYDVVFIPFNSIHHLYSNKDFFDALNVVRKHLKPDGLFLLDCYNPDIEYIINTGKELTEISQFITSDGSDVSIKQIMRYERSTQINRIEWHYFINGNFDSIQKLDMRMFFPQELDTYIKSAGFEILNKYGGFNKEEFVDDSEKQIFVCK